MPRTVTAFFENRETAARAVERLVEAGFQRAQVRLVEGATMGAATNRTPPAEHGFWESLKDLFLPDEDRYTYAEGLRRGGYLVTAATTAANYSKALDILDAEGTVNIDERAETWRKEGWKGWSAGATGSPGTSGVAAGRQERLPVVEERLKVGKREVGHGRVRVRSYVIETPVTEQVNLREEHVHVERRPVNRPATGADAAFQERAIEARETREEAVVAKEARVKEEVVVKKDVEQRTQTVSDTVRRAEVKVEDERSGARPTPPPTTPRAQR